jgi:uncharacterized membrane protein
LSAVPQSVTASGKQRTPAKQLAMSEKETLRVEGFSDGVFGVALTLLIVEIKLPTLEIKATNHDVLVALLSLWPAFLAFAMSFITILIMWINHHSLFKLVHGTNRRLLMANGLLLALVTFVNFPTAVLADHLDQSAAHTVAAFYCGTYIAISVAFNLLLFAAIPNMRPSVTQGPHSPVQRIRIAYLFGLFAYAVATVVALFAPYVSLAICAAMWIVWTLLNYRTGRATTVMGADQPERDD